MPTATKVSTGKPGVSGAVYRAPTGTTLPTTADETLNSAFVELGFVSEDGVTNTNSPESDNIKAWGGQVVMVVQTEKADEWKLTFIESLNPNVLKMVYGDSHVTEGVGSSAGIISVEATADVLAEKAYVIDMVMRGGALKRVVIPTGAIKEVGDIVYKDDEAVGYEITITAMPNSAGKTHFEYIKLPTT